MLVLTPSSSGVVARGPAHVTWLSPLQVRYHSLYPWHEQGSYTGLEDDHDRCVKGWADVDRWMGGWMDGWMDG
jgi:hypothetical protein